MPEAEAGGEFVAKEVAGVVEGGHRLPLLLFAPADGHFDGRMAAIGRDMGLDDLDREQTRVLGLKPNDLSEFLPNRFRNS